MAKTKASQRKAQLLSLVVLATIVTVLCFSLTPRGSAASGGKDPKTSTSMLDQAVPAVRRQILMAAMQVFEPSLEMKENVDFLLTPALLVQQAISEGVVITYPSE